MIPTPKHCITFDIDELLVCRRTMYLNHARFFQAKGAIVLIPFSKTEAATQYVFPGVRELLQKVCNLETVRVAFFSSGHEIRNKWLVEKLLTDSLGENHYLQIKDRINIFSGHHLSPSYKKDLSIVVNSSIPLEETILADDKPRNVSSDQLQNLLYVPPSTSLKLHQFDRKCTIYEKEGYRFLKIYFESDRSLWWNHLARRGNAIIVVQTQEGFDITFVEEKTHKFQRISLPKEENEKFFEALVQEYQENTSPEKYPPWILEKIREIVSSHGGKTTKIWRSANRIYYLAGCIFKILEEAQEKNLPLSKCLAELYTPTSNRQDALFSIMSIKSKHDELYHFGLKKLREVNPALEFITPHTYRDCVERICLADLAELNLALDHELD